MTNKGVLYNFFLFQDHRLASVNEIDFIFIPIFFQIHKSRLYFSNDEFFPLKFNESFVNWRIVSMSPVQILKIKVLFTKIWLKIKVLFYFKSFSFVSSCINEDSYDLFSLKTLFLFPFHSVFHSVPFSVPFSVPRFSNTPHSTNGISEYPVFHIFLDVKHFNTLYSTHSVNPTLSDRALILSYRAYIRFYRVVMLSYRVWMLSCRA